MGTRLAGSAVLGERAESLTPGGVHSNVRLTAPPVVFERGEGAWLYDVDGNDYIDYVLGQGPCFLGHAPATVNEAVAAAMTRGTVYGSRHVLENAAAEVFLDTVRWAERVRFGLTGTEADQAALRLARAATGRRRFVRFAGHYHGWLDNVLTTTGPDGVTGPASKGQLASHLDDAYVLPYNDPDALATLLGRVDDVAAVILEPVMCNSGVVEPEPGYLSRVRELCDRHGIVLIFDEVITGFRVALGGAAERFGVVPDLAVYGKALAGGWPVSALAGSAALMDQFTTGVNHSGTFNSSVPACAAVTAALTVLRDDPPYERLATLGTKLMQDIGDLGAAHGLPLRVQGLPMAFHVSFGPPGPVRDHAGVLTLDLNRYHAFSHTLAQHGVWTTSRGVWYLSVAHTAADVATTVERLDRALAAVGHQAD